MPEKKDHTYWLKRIKDRGIKRGYRCEINFRPSLPIPPFNTFLTKTYIDVAWFKKDKLCYAFEVEDTNNNNQIVKNSKKLKQLAKYNIQVYHIKIDDNKPILLWSDGYDSKKNYEGKSIKFHNVLKRIHGQIVVDRVKRNSGEFLPLLLHKIDKYGNNLQYITEQFGISKQSLNYWLNKTIKQGFVKKVQSYPFAIYELTSFGKRVKKITTQSEEGKKLVNIWDCHNLIVGFNILHFGNFHFENTQRRKLIHMNNWHYVSEKVGDFTINIQSTGLLKIYCPRRTGIYPDQEFARLMSEAQKIAQDYCNRHNMKIGLLKLIRKGQKSLKNSKKLTEALGRFKVDGVWVDASTGIDEIEANQDNYHIEEILELPKKFNELLGLNKSFMGNIDKYNQNIELHLEVMEKMSKSLDVMNEKLQNLGDNNGKS